MSEIEPAPENLAQLRQVLADSACVLPVGNRTKRPLSCDSQAKLVSLRALRGIIEYEPSEFTFTARAGTPLSEIDQVLREKRQYLPFDPILVDAGATIGGTIASGLSGPGRFRYGGIRDFLIGVKFLDGDGELIQGGGKVVKNAAGFDLPKFLVGSMGRYAMMVEVSFKVFPKPPATCTLRLPTESHHDAMQRISEVARSRWEADAIDYRPGERSLFIRLAGPDRAIHAIAEEIQSTWPGGELLASSQADEFWHRTRELRWEEDGPALVAKVPTTNTSFLSLQQAIQERDDVSVHLSVAGGVTWIGLAGQPQVTWLDNLLNSLDLPGLVVLGPCVSPRIGTWHVNKMQQAVKTAMDPHNKFPGI